MGKSTAGQLLSARGILVIDTDQLAREESAAGTSGFEEIVSAFGREVIGPDGQLNRARLAQRIFEDSSARLRLEGILHPRIANSWRAEVERAREAGHSEMAVLIPLLFERGYQEEFSMVVTVACSKDTQRVRLQSRGWSDSQIQARNQAQLPVAEKMVRARFVVWTEGELETHCRQWDRILG
ncbi:MAG: dephospho-CoA kinase [Verrucomicrobia bacterium]|nr:dephospho-CoA kinase [Verrucomicrobiota bacterium]